MAIFDLIFYFGSAFVIPVVGLIFYLGDAEKTTDIAGFCYLVPILNSFYFAGINMHPTIVLIKLLKKNFDLPEVMNKFKEESEVFLCDDDKKIACSCDIYEFSWTIMLKPEYLEELCPENKRLIDSIGELDISTFLSTCFICIATVASLIGMVWKEQFSSGNLKQAPEAVMVARLLASIIFHFAYGDEIKNSLMLIQFTCLNREKFRSQSLAYFIAFCQFGITIMVEIVSIVSLNKTEGVDGVL